MLVVTSDTLPGYEIRQVLGYVAVSIACTRNPFDAGVKSLDGELVDRGRALTERRDAAVLELEDAAAQLGANAVVAMRFDHRDVTNAWVEVCAYGTAVVVQPTRTFCPCSSAE